jgi:hypothetical protein
MMSVFVQRFSSADLSRHRITLAEILRDAVDGGTSVSFVVPLAEGIGRAMMLAAEKEAVKAGRTLLTLDHFTDGEAEAEAEGEPCATVN